MADRSLDWLNQAFRDMEQAEDSRRAGRHEWACFAEYQAILHHCRWQYCIIVDGGVDEYSQIVNVRDIPMALLRQKVQHHVLCFGYRVARKLTNPRRAIPRTRDNLRLIIDR